MDTYLLDKIGQYSNSSETTNDIFKDGMNFELFRLATFKKWPVWAPVMPNRLARNGFFYRGTIDEVECFSCHTVICRWHGGDRIGDRHRRVAPACNFLNNTDTTNVELKRPAGQQIMHSDSLGTPQSAIQREGFQTDTSSIPRSVLLPAYQQMQPRLDTFRNWPETAYVSAEELAEAGFIYLGSQDRVQCAFCKGVLRNWAPGDRAFVEHQKHFPNCTFVHNPSAANTIQTPTQPNVSANHYIVPSLYSR